VTLERTHILVIHHRDISIINDYAVKGGGGVEDESA